MRRFETVMAAPAAFPDTLFPAVPGPGQGNRREYNTETLRFPAELIPTAGAGGILPIHSENTGWSGDCIAHLRLNQTEGAQTCRGKPAPRFCVF